MNQSYKSIINLGKPLVLLNGLVTDKNNYTEEQKIKMLKSKKALKNKIPTNPKIIPHSSEIKAVNNNIMPLSEEEDIDNSVKVISKFNNLIPKKSEENDDNIMNKEIKNTIPKYNNNEMYKINLSNKDEKIKKKKEKNNQNKTEIKRGKQKNKTHDNNNLIISDFSSDNNNNNNTIELGVNNNTNKEIRKLSKKRFISQKKEENIEIKLEYKNVPKVNTYEEIIKTCKNDSCAYVTLLNSDDIKNIIEEKSQIFSVNKKLKKEKKETIIFSDKNNEINLTKNLLYSLKEEKYNFDLFKKLSPEQNNILQFMPLHYTGINNYGYMNINYNITPSLNKGEDEIHFITNFFNDKNSNYVLLFRKYILNLSCFKSNDVFNNDRDYNIYHIIIPKKSVNKININFSEETSFNSLIQKLNCDYYFYSQQPGELLIVEPESILLSFYYKENIGFNLNSNNSNLIPFEKNYLLMFWNKMNTEHFSDYLILQNITKNEKYKYFPIVNTLINLVNKQSGILSNDIIKIILEIYNDFDLYENINAYIKEISENNIRFHKLYLNSIYLCQHCGQEIFNFYVYYPKENNNYNGNSFHWDKNMIMENENICNNNINGIGVYNSQYNGQFICVKCAHNKHFFNEKKNIIFFKYTKDEVNNLISSITSKINRFRSKDNYDIINKNFFTKRSDDCINMDEFLLKIDGPIRILDSEYEKNKNDLISKKNKVDKYLKYFEKKDEDKIEKDIDPLNNDNFNNSINENDLYENLELNFVYPMNVSFDFNENGNNRKSKIENKNSINMNFVPFNFDKNNDKNIFVEEEKEIIKEKNNEKNNNNYNYNVNRNKKNKKKNGTNLQDIIFSGEF